MTTNVSNLMGRTLNSFNGGSEPRGVSPPGNAPTYSVYQGYATDHERTVAAPQINFGIIQQAETSITRSSVPIAPARINAQSYSGQQVGYTGYQPPPPSGYAGWNAASPSKVGNGRVEPPSILGSNPR